MNEDERKLWIERIESYKSSGLTAVKWCEINNVSIYKLRHRITCLNKEKKQKTKKIQWASVITTENKRTIESKPQDIPLKVTVGHSTIEVSSGFDPETFKSVVEILSKC